MSVIDTLRTDHYHKEEYTSVDLNRVGEAINYIRDRLKADCAVLCRVQAKTDWTYEDEPTCDELNAYITAINTIKDRYNGTQDIPQSMAQLSSEGANDIEKALLQMEGIINKMLASRSYWCGQSYCGVM